jgi:tetratricopeptide (TPR) repeat protein
MWWFRHDRSPERPARQREEAQRALRLAPELPQAQVAMGQAQGRYHDRRDWQAALEWYRIALQGLPNDRSLWARIGYTHRLQGNWDEVEAAFAKATKLDPLNATVFYETGGNTYRMMRRYPDAIVAYDSALTLAPDLHSAAVDKGLVYLNWKGELDTLRAALEQLPPDVELEARLVGTPIQVRPGRMVVARANVRSVPCNAYASLILTRNAFSPVPLNAVRAAANS